MKTKDLTITLIALGFAATGATAGPDAYVPVTMPEQASATGFEGVRRPITNPTLFDLALPRTLIHPIFMHHRFPDRLNVNNIGPSQVDFGGDLNLYALQFEYALNDEEDNITEDRFTVDLVWTF